MMKSLLTLVLVAVVAMVAAPAMAEDGNVSQVTLSSLGLGGMQLMSDAQGMQVRGLSASAMASGGSLTFGQLVHGSNFFVASDVNSSAGTDENAGLAQDALATSGQGSAVLGALQIDSGNPLVTIFLGTFGGSAGAAANAAAGAAAATGN